ncbi:protein phosphatase 2C domain-containing protein [Amycolatopsis sp. NBC_00348]|uniref:protein phosphatase 2C domain-containing protein n=1 Tax=Amycolatopsis sp. NBC_00348 TaxID=2975956 RepID=UPI002E2565FE
MGSPGRAPSRVVPLPDLEFARVPDTIVDGFSLRDAGLTEQVRVRAVSLRGLSHRCYGRVRQDTYDWRVTADDRYLVVCVADGVSAGRLSHLAADQAGVFGTRLLCEQLADTAPAELRWDELLDATAEAILGVGAAFVAPKAAVGTEAARWEIAEHMATTVLYAVVDLVPADGRHDVTLLTVGDTSAWVLGTDGRWRAQQPIKNEGDEIYSPAVVALPILPSVASRPVRTGVAPGEALVLMTDGVGDPLGDGTGAVADFLAESWREPPADLEFAAQAGFSRRSFDDDRTVFALWPVGRS